MSIETKNNIRLVKPIQSIELPQGTKAEKVIAPSVKTSSFKNADNRFAGITAAGSKNVASLFGSTLSPAIKEILTTVRNAKDVASLEGDRRADLVTAIQMAIA